MYLKNNLNESFKNIRDDKGNILTLKNNGKRIIIYLKLPRLLKVKKIGTIDINKRLLKIRRNREKHLFKKFNAYGLNFYILKNGRTFDFIKIIDNYETFILPKEFAEQNCKYLQFSKQGFELQGFISLDQLQQFKI